MFAILTIMRRLFLQIITGILGIFLAIKFVPGVTSTGSWQTIILVGLILGLINFFIKPILKLITLPFRILTLGLFSVLINIGVVWIVDLVFAGIAINGFLALFLTTIMIWCTSLIVSAFIKKK